VLLRVHARASRSSNLVHALYAAKRWSGCPGKRMRRAADYAQEIHARDGRMLGISEEAGELFRRWVYEALEWGQQPDIAKRAIAEMGAFFTAEVARRRLEPGDDLVSYLLDVRIAGEPLSDEHIANTLRLLLLAGITSTWSMIGVRCGIWQPMRTIDAAGRRAGTDPDAIEEFLRAYTGRASRQS